MLIFVFGSNLAGRHGKGAALTAVEKYKAVEGVGEGPTGQCYAIPTKDKHLKVRNWDLICDSIDNFLTYAARRNRDTKDVFFLTPIGCGLAGYRAKDVFNYLQLKGLPSNVVLSHHWINDHKI
jgi:hypothetical protein